MASQGCEKLDDVVRHGIGALVHLLVWLLEAKDKLDNGHLKKCDCRAALLVIQLGVSKLLEEQPDLQHEVIGFCHPPHHVLVE